MWFPFDHVLSSADPLSTGPYGIGIPVHKDYMFLPNSSHVCKKSCTLLCAVAARAKTTQTTTNQIFTINTFHFLHRKLILKTNQDEEFQSLVSRPNMAMCIHIQNLPFHGSQFGSDDAALFLVFGFLRGMGLIGGTVIWPLALATR